MAVERQTKTRTAQLVKVLDSARRVNGIARELLCLYSRKVSELVHSDAELVESAKSVVNRKRGATSMMCVFCARSSEKGEIASEQVVENVDSSCGCAGEGMSVQRPQRSSLE